MAACKAAGADAIAVQGDVSKDEDCKRLVQACLDKWGRLDVLVNNAATTKPIPHRRMDLLDKDEFERVFARQRDRQLSDDARRRAASQGERRRRDRQYFLGRRHARRRQLDGLYGLEGRAQQSDALDRRACSRRRCGSMRCARAACSAPGPAKFSTEKQYQERLDGGEDRVSAAARHLAARCRGRGAVSGRRRHHDDRRVHPHGLRPAPWASRNVELSQPKIAQSLQRAVGLERQAAAVSAASRLLVLLAAAA